MRCFDVSLDFPVTDIGPSLKALIIIRKKAWAATFRDYKAAGKSGTHFAGVCSDFPFSLKWKDSFEVRSPSRKSLGRGTVLHPFADGPIKPRNRIRIARLELLSGDEKDMLLALAEEKGFQGLREKDVVEFGRLEPEDLERAANKLEEEGRIRILAFSPLAVLSQSGFEFLCQRMLEFLSRYHDKHPEARGVAIEKIAKRFEVEETVLKLALKHLVKTGDIQRLEDIIALSSFKVPLSPQEEEILKDLEQMCFEGKFSTVTLEDVGRRFKISPGRLQTLLSLLVERKKIVQGKEGFYLHSLWLEEIVKRIRGSGKKDLSVADFKAMTGLSRKFAIPLLELLDEMGVTRRKGPGREILEDDRGRRRESR